jgi:hypothetical protein
MIFSMKVCDHPPVCDVLSRPSSDLLHQGQMVFFDFWGHFRVRDIAFFYNSTSIYDLWHEYELPSGSVSRISMLYIGP